MPFGEVQGYRIAVVGLKRRRLARFLGGRRQEFAHADQGENENQSSETHERGDR